MSVNGQRKKLLINFKTVLFFIKQHTNILFTPLPVLKISSHGTVHCIIQWSKDSLCLHIHRLVGSVEMFIHPHCCFRYFSNILLFYSEIRIDYWKKKNETSIENNKLKNALEESPAVWIPFKPSVKSGRTAANKVLNNTFIIRSINLFLNEPYRVATGLIFKITE